MDEDPIADELPRVRYDVFDPHKSFGFIVEKRPFIEFSDSRSLTHEERHKLRVLSSVYAAAKIMELDDEVSKEAARIALSLYERWHSLKVIEVIAVVLAAAAEKGVAVTRESVERAYERLTMLSKGRPFTPTGDVFNEIKRKFLRVMMELNMKINKDDLIVSYVNILANAIGADDASRMPMIVLARSIDRSRPAYSAAAAVEFFNYMMRLNRDSESLWKMLWPPVERKRFIIDGASIAVGTGNVEAPEPESRTVTVVCASCGARLFSVNHKPPSPVNYDISQIPFHVPAVCPHCGARLWNGNRLMIRSVKVLYKFRHNGNEVMMIRASALMPMESSVAVKEIERPS
jgi:DNA-directed RNA polymerase subunit RPC12/RpoP